jgi:hypothetical protein
VVFKVPENSFAPPHVWCGFSLFTYKFFFVIIDLYSFPNIKQITKKLFLKMQGKETREAHSNTLSAGKHVLGINIRMEEEPIRVFHYGYNIHHVPQ